MGLFKTIIKVAAAPVYIPYKVARKCSKPSNYEYWHHDSGIPTCDDFIDRSSCQYNDTIKAREEK